MWSGDQWDTFDSFHGSGQSKPLEPRLLNLIDILVDACIPPTTEVYVGYYIKDATY